MADQMSSGPREASMDTVAEPTVEGINDRMQVS